MNPWKYLDKNDMPLMRIAYGGRGNGKNYTRQLLLKRYRMRNVIDRRKP